MRRTDRAGNPWSLVVGREWAGWGGMLHHSTSPGRNGKGLFLARRAGGVEGGGVLRGPWGGGGGGGGGGGCFITVRARGETAGGYSSRAGRGGRLTRGRRPGIRPRAHEPYQCNP